MGPPGWRRTDESLASDPEAEAAGISAVLSDWYDRVYRSTLNRAMVFSWEMGAELSPELQLSRQQLQYQSSMPATCQYQNVTSRR